MVSLQYSSCVRILSGRSAVVVEGAYLIMISGTDQLKVHLQVDLSKSFSIYNIKSRFSKALYGRNDYHANVKSHFTCFLEFLVFQSVMQDFFLLFNDVDIFLTLLQEKGRQILILQTEGRVQ